MADNTQPAGIVRLKNVRLAFPELFEAKQVNGEGKPSFSAIFILPPNHPQIAEIEAAEKAVAKAKWGAKADAVLKAAAIKDRRVLHDGATKASKYEGFEDNMFISSRNQTRPTVLNRDKTPLVREDGVIYSGCYVNCSIELWAQDNSYGQAVNASLRGVQFVKDGDAFSGGGVASDDEFDDMGDGADAEDLT